MSTQTTFKSVYRPITKVIDEVLPSGTLDFSTRATSLDFIQNQTKIFYNLINIQHFTNNQIVIISNRATENIVLSANLLVANKSISVKPNTASIFIYLHAEQKFFDIVNSAQFDELQSIINLIDLDVISLQNLTSIHETEIDNLKTRVDSLETEQNDFLYIKEKIIINSESQLSYIDLQHQAVPNSIILSIDRFAVHLDQDFTASVENGVTRLTWINDLISPSGQDKVELNDVVLVSYKIPNVQKVDFLFKKEKIIIQTEDQLSYIDLQYQAVPNTIIASIDRLMVFLNEDFTTSTVNGITRLTWAGPLVNPTGQEKIELNDVLFINYKVPNNFYSL